MRQSKPYVWRIILRKVYASMLVKYGYSCVFYVYAQWYARLYILMFEGRL